MPSRWVLGCNAGSLLDRRGRPVLPEYTYNVIRKYNSVLHLMCLIGGGFDFKAFCLKVVDSGFYPENIGFYGDFRGMLAFVGKVHFK